MFKNNGYKYNKHLLNSIEKYGFDAFEVDEEFDKAYSQEELNLKEIYWIDFYDSYKNGYNNNIGGDGNRGYDGLKGADNPSSRSVIQLDLDGSYIRDWVYITLAEKELGILRSDICGTCSHDKMSAGGYVWVYKDEYDESKDYSYKTNFNKTPIVKLNMEGSFIKRYESVSDACRDDVNLEYRSIYASLNGSRNQYGGYIWVREDEYDSCVDYSYKMPIKGVSKPIDMFSLDDKYIKTFSSINKAHKELGIPRKKISDVINKNINHFNNYKFKYTYNLECKL